MILCSWNVKILFKIFWKMLNLQKKLKEQHAAASTSSSSTSSSPKESFARISIRDKLLVQEVQELSVNLPTSCHVDYPSSSNLHSFTLTIKPEDGFYVGGAFKFQIEVPPEYNIIPPSVKCMTRLWHPNITEDGSVCLSLLRPSSVDGMGWAPTRRLKDVVWGLNSLFFDLIDFDDPLNIEAAEHYRKNSDDFKLKVKDYVRRYC